MTPPDYFNRVAASSEDLWAKLKDPVLAGPWKQLFAQVQSPRHVLFVAEESLTRGVEIPYELWRLMQINPDSIALVLSAENGEPSEWSASELQKLKADGQLHLRQSRFILKETTP
jgi:hypothetical protein